MRVLGRGLLWAVMILLVVGGLALLGLNLYLRSPGIRDKVEAGFQRRLRVPVSYDAVSYFPWRGLRVRGLKMPHTEEVMGRTEKPFFEADMVEAKMSVWSLLDHPIQMGDIRVVRPVVTTTQSASGGVALPWVSSAPPMVAASGQTGQPRVGIPRPVIPVPSSEDPVSAESVEDPVESVPP